MQQRTRFTGLLLLFWLMLLGCSPIVPPSIDPAAGAVESTGATPVADATAAEQPFLGGMAMVDTVEIRVLESLPVQVQVVAMGNLPDGCTEIGEAIVEQIEDAFTVTLTTRRPADAMCTQAIIPFEEIIPLSVDDLPAGEYTVTVNDVTESFTLDVTNTAADPLLPTPIAPVTTTASMTLTTTSGQWENGVRYRDLAINLDDTFTSTAQLTFPPSGEGPWPTVILFPGSGPYDLDATTNAAAGEPSSTNFRLLAEELGAAGIAVLRFNKRGVLAYGEYDMEQAQQASVNQSILDAEAILATATAQAEVNTEQIFLYGWSEGAKVVVNVATAHPELAGLILQAPPNGGLDETLQYQQLEVALPYLRNVIDENDDGQLSREELVMIPPGPTWYTTLFYIWASDASPESLSFQPGLDTNGDELIDIEQELLPVMEQQIPLFAEGYAAVSPVATTAETVAELEMQVLILHGRMDGWVSFRNAEVIAVAAPGTATITIYPNLGHALSPTTEPAADVFGVMAGRPIENIVNWIERVIGQTTE